jgi:hypothetical protein
VIGSIPYSYDRDDLDQLLRQVDIPPSWKCPHCGRRSYHPEDLANRYCGHCHHYCDDVDQLAAESVTPEIN